MTLKEELEELYQLKLSIESQGFQKHLIKPLYAELEKLKNAYDCETLRELATLKGRKRGLKFLIELLKKVDLDIKNLKYEIEKLESQRD